MDVTGLRSLGIVEVYRVVLIPRGRRPVFHEWST